VKALARRAVLGETRAGAAAAEEARGAGLPHGRGDGDMDPGSRDRGRLRLVSAAREADGTRWSRVERARARIAARFYDRDDVREELLDAILDELMHR